MHNISILISILTLLQEAVAKKGEEKDIPMPSGQESAQGELSSMIIDVPDLPEAQKVRGEHSCTALI